MGIIGNVYTFENPFHFVMNSETLIISCEMCDVEFYVKVVISSITNFPLSIECAVFCVNGFTDSMSVIR